MVVHTDDAIIGKSLRMNGAWEEAALPEVVAYLRRRYGFRPTLLVDVGANIGTHLLRGLAEGVFARGIAVEMNADNHRLLACNLALNGLAARTRLFQAAVSDRPGHITMEMAPQNRGEHRVRLAPSSPGLQADAYGEAARRICTVPATTLNAIEAKSGEVFDAGTLVWIDVQGHEGHVVDGAAGILGRESRPVFVIEFWPYGLERAWGRDRLFRFLERCRAIHEIGAGGQIGRAHV